MIRITFRLNTGDHSKTLPFIMNANSFKVKLCVWNVGDYKLDKFVWVLPNKIHFTSDMTKLIVKEKYAILRFGAYVLVVGKMEKNEGRVKNLWHQKKISANVNWWITIIVDKIFRYSNTLPNDGI